MAIEGDTSDATECPSIDISFRRRYVSNLNHMKELDTAILRTLVMIKSKLRDEMVRFHRVLSGLATIVGRLILWDFIFYLQCLTDSNLVNKDRLSSTRKDAFYEAQMLTEEQQKKVLEAREVCHGGSSIEFAIGMRQPG
jgi:hypothetical protein